MDIEKLMEILIGLLAEQEGVQIEYRIEKTRKRLSGAGSRIPIV